MYHICFRYIYVSIRTVIPSKKDRGFKGVIKQILNTDGKKKIRETKTTTNESKDRKPTPTPLKPGMNSGAPEG